MLGTLHPRPRFKPAAATKNPKCPPCLFGIGNINLTNAQNRMKGVTKGPLLGRTTYTRILSALLAAKNICPPVGVPSTFPTKSLYVNQTEKIFRVEEWSGKKEQSVHFFATERGFCSPPGPEENRILKWN